VRAAGELARVVAALADALLALRHAGSPAVGLYEALAERYDAAHGRWLRRAGEALAALQGCLLAELRAGRRVLDVGCGTGSLARWMTAVEPRLVATLVDASPAMLARADVPGARRVRADAARLPFADESFDVVVCAWVLETVAEPERALRELARVLVPGGLLALCFCSLPTSPRDRWRSSAVRLLVERLYRGRFLPPAFPGDAGRGAAGLAAGAGGFRRLHASGGLATFALARKGQGGSLGAAWSALY
jgi:ubiquinone/menaquinone biosynthesis C-methylase UbiE